MNKECLANVLELLEAADRLDKINAEYFYLSEYHSLKEAEQLQQQRTTHAIELIKNKIGWPKVKSTIINIDELITFIKTEKYHEAHDELTKLALEAFADCECWARQPGATTKLAPKIKFTDIKGLPHYGG